MRCTGPFDRASRRNEELTIENQNEAVIPAPESGNTAAPETVETTTPEEQQEPKTFTQEDLDRIIAAEKAKVERKLRREMAQQPEQVQAPTEAPNPEKFKTADEYVDALADWKAEQKLAAKEAKQQITQVESTYAEREEVVREKYEDFQKVVYNDDLRITEEMALVIKESEVGPELAYHLGKNPDEALRISKMSPLGQARELGKIEATLVATPPTSGKKASSAPEPIRPVGSRSATPKYDTTDPRSTSVMSTAEWIAAENARRAKNAR